MLELLQDVMKFSFAEVHPHAKMSINFQRTIRIPDDGKIYPLPQGFGKFPIRHVDDFEGKVPAKWLEHGGTIIPMYQAEALWIKFDGNYDPERRVHYPFAVKISTGKVSAINGEEYKNGIQVDDYCVIPDQKYIDGYTVEKGKIRQFVASVMGSGVSVEQQMTGKDEFGGIQIEVFPMKRSEYESRFPVYIAPPSQKMQYSSALRSRGMMSGGSYGSMGGSIGSSGSWTSSGSSDMKISANASFSANVSNERFDSNSDMTNDFGLNGIVDMSMAAGGTMEQQIFSDKYGIEVWDTENCSRCFVHLTNSAVWETITGQKPPETPITSALYQQCGYPWFDYYVEQHSISASDKLKNIKSVKEAQTTPILPENQSVEVKGHVKQIGEKKSPNAVRNGTW